MTTEVQTRKFEYPDGGFIVVYPNGAKTVCGKIAHKIYFPMLKLERFFGELLFEHQIEILEDSVLQENRCYNVSLWASHENCTYPNYTQCYTVSSGDCILLATDYLQKHPFHALTEMVIAPSKEDALSKFQKWQKDGMELEYLTTI